MNQWSATPTEAPKFGYTLTLSGTSDYIFRGVSFTDNDPAFQPYLEFTYGIAYLGFWGSNINNGCPAEICYEPWEMDIYAGLRPVTGPEGWRRLNWDIGVLYYTYPDAPGAGRLDYVEFKISATETPFTNLTLGFNAYATPDQALAITETETIEGTAAYTLPKFHGNIYADAQRFNRIYPRFYKRGFAERPLSIGSGLHILECRFEIGG